MITPISCEDHMRIVLEDGELFAGLVFLPNSVIGVTQDAWAILKE